MLQITVKVRMPTAEQLLQRHGLQKDGPVQQFWTNTIRRRVSRYMPYRSGALSSKLTFVSKPSEITTLGPYARYQYYGHVMVNAATGKGPRVIPGVGLRWPKGASLRQTQRPLQYDSTKNSKAGPLWDKRLMEAEGDAVLAELHDYVRAREGRL